MPHRYVTLLLEEHSRPSRTTSLPPAPHVPVHLEDGLVENFHLKKPRGAWEIFISALGHGLAVALIILIPLVYTHAFDLPQYEKTFLVAPPPPPPPPPAPLHAVVHAPPKSFLTQGKLFAPTVIPKKIAEIKEQLPSAGPFIGATGGVPGGVPGGQLGGVLGGILGGNRQVPSPPPPRAPTHAGPYPVGGRVQAPQLIRQVQPVYPILAKEARIQGDVQLDCVIDQQGSVTQMKIVSGHPLLVNAAFDAVRQWKYQPTLLNGEPVAVEMVVTVHFVLGS